MNTTQAEHYRMRDTERPSGVRIIWSRETLEDHDATPADWMDPNDVDDAKRIEAWRKDHWRFIGIRAVAEIEVTSNGVSIVHTLTSAGLWGIESDSGEEYLAEVFDEEKAQLLHDIKALAEHASDLE